MNSSIKSFWLVFHILSSFFMQGLYIFPPPNPQLFQSYHSLFLKLFMSYYKTTYPGDTWIPLNLLFACMLCICVSKINLSPEISYAVVTLVWHIPASALSLCRWVSHLHPKKMIVSLQQALAVLFLLCRFSTQQAWTKRISTIGKLASMMFLCMD